MRGSSNDTLLVVLELHDEGLDVLALGLPLLNALLSVRVEVFLLLVSESLGLQRVSLSLLELTNSVSTLDVSLILLEVLELSVSLSLFFLLLLLSKLQLLVADVPELGKLSLLLLHGGLLGLLALDLQLTRSLDGGLHLSRALLWSLVSTVGTVLSFGNLAVKNLLLVVLEGSEVLDLAVDHFLSSGLLIGEALLLTFLLQGIEMITLLGELFNLLFLLNFL